MKKQEIIELFKDGKVLKFSYFKKDGSLRKALGTISGDIVKKLIPQDESTRHKIESSNRGSSRTVAYYDIGAKGFRSFVPEKFISIDENYSL